MVMPHLSLEIISNILSRLPFEHAIPCKQVCKAWRNLLDHIKRDKKINLLVVVWHDSHALQLYHGEYDEKNNKKLDEQLSYNALTRLGRPRINYINRLMAGSHRGLVCLHETHDIYTNVKYPIYICNPVTQETVLLPQLTLPKDAKDDFLVIGFGYLYATNEYKIVRIYYEYGKRSGGLFPTEDDTCEAQVHVYTLGDNKGWRNKGITNYLLSKSHGVLYDGALHWITNSGLEIVAFDLADEQFRSVPIPSCFPVKLTHPYAQLLLFGGYLTIVLRRYTDTKGSTDIWLLKKPNKKSGHTAEGHWSCEFSIHSKEGYYGSPIYHPFALTEENKVMIWNIGTSKGRENTLCQYDPKTATLEEFLDPDAEKSQKLGAIPYMKSDVSLTVLEPDLLVVNWDI